MTVRYLFGSEALGYRMGAEMCTDSIAEVLDFIENRGYTSDSQNEALEFTLITFWSTFQRLRDVMVMLTTEYVHVCTSHEDMHAGMGWIEARIDHSGYIDFKIGEVGGHKWGTRMFTPYQELKWDRFWVEVNKYVRPATFGRRL